MADVKSVAIRLQAINADYKRGMTESGDATSQFGRVAGVALAAAATAAVAFAKKAADAYVDYGKEIMKLSRTSGENIETSSKMAFAAQQSGVSSETLATGIKFLEKNMAAANPEFAKLGVNVKDSGGNLRSVHAVFLDTADALSHMSNGAEKTDAILKVFGRSGLALAPLLNKGRDAILALEAETAKYGLVLTQDNVAAIQANITAHRQLDAAMMGLQVQIGQNVLPALTGLAQGAATVTQALGYVPGPVMAIGAGLTAAVVLGPKVVAAFQSIAASGELMSTAMSAGAAVGIAVVLKGMHDIEERSKAMQTSLSGGIDWTNYGKAAHGLNAESAAVNKLGEAWNAKSAAEKLSDPGAYKVYADAAAQAEEDAKHFAELTARIKALGGALGISAPAAQKLADSLKIDLVHVDPAVYIPILRGVANGTITAADATERLGAASRTATTSTEDLTAANEERSKKTKEANDAEKAGLEPQFAMIDAQRKLADAQDNVGRAEERRTDAARKLTDAIATQRDAQRALDDLLRGPSLDERDTVEAAAIALAEARRRAAGASGIDPELERRRNALDVRRAEAGLRQAEGAHDKAIADARKNLAAADQGVADARRGVVDAENAVRDAHLGVVKAAEAADSASRNLITAIANGDASIDNSAAALQRWVDQGKITADQAWEVAKAFAAAKAAAEGGNPDQAAAAVGPKAPAPEADAEWLKQHPGWRNVEAHARGGALAEGWSLVGEEGPELVHKRGSSARVSSAPVTRGLLAAHPSAPLPASPPMGAGAGGYTHHGDIIIGKATERTAFDIVWAQRKQALTLGRR